MGGETGLTAATAVMQQWGLSSMVKLVDSGSGYGVDAAAVG
jgi:hypothetical protein